VIVKLQDAVTREPLHTRSIKIDGFRRSDGLFEVEGRLVDTKPFSFQPPSLDRLLHAGEAIHDMVVRIVFDERMTVHDVIAVADAAPYPSCQQGPATLKRLIGLSMTRGWSAAVKQHLAGAASCNHLMGLMVPMAAVAFQSTVLHRLEQQKHLPGGMVPKVDSCIAYASDGEIVRTRWPTLYIAKADPG
jgi:Protein of unknown function (DUF2889)